MRTPLDLSRLRDASLGGARDSREAPQQPPKWNGLLMCLDEFERLEEVVDEKPEAKRQLAQLMGLLRLGIQHRCECGC